MACPPASFNKERLMSIVAASVVFANIIGLSKLVLLAFSEVFARAMS